MFLWRVAVGLMLVTQTAFPAQADDLLFIGNSFTFGASAPAVRDHGGVAQLVRALAQARGRQVTTKALAVGGKDWSYHLSRWATMWALRSKTWSWVVLQDYSTRPTHVGDMAGFRRDGEEFSRRIAASSPHAGIVLFETWARSPGSFYNGSPGHDFYGPRQMMAELHASYGQLAQTLAREDESRPVRVALVGTAFARAREQFPEINLDAKDQHHASNEGYYLAALVIYETIFHEHVAGAPSQFYHGALVIPPGEATKLQQVADEVAGGAK